MFSHDYPIRVVVPGLRPPHATPRQTDSQRHHRRAAKATVTAGAHTWQHSTLCGAIAPPAYFLSQRRIALREGMNAFISHLRTTRIIHPADNNPSISESNSSTPSNVNIRRAHCMCISFCMKMLFRVGCPPLLIVMCHIGTNLSRFTRKHHPIPRPGWTVWCFRAQTPK